MSTEECLWSFLSEAAKPDLPFFPPLPQADAPPPESFDTEFEGLDFEGVQLPEDPFSQFRGNTPVYISPSVFTHSTESGYDLAASEYSYGYPHSNYSMPLEAAFQNVRVSSEYGGVDTLQNPAYPPAFNDMASFGALPPTPSPSPPLRMGKAQSDYGPSKSRQSHFGISPDNLSLPRQQPTTPTVPPVLPVQVPDKHRHGRAHQCPNCSRGKVIHNNNKPSPTQFYLQPSRAHSTSRHIWRPTTQRESSNMCAHTVAASVLSVENMTFNAIVRPYTVTKHPPHHYTRIHPGFRSLPSVLLPAAETGARSVDWGLLGVKEVVIASTSSEG